MRIKVAVLAMTVLSLLTACGGGGGGSSVQPTITAVKISPYGSYVLTSTTSDMVNTSTNVRQVITATPNDTPPCTGTLKIGVTSWSKVLNYGDGAGNINANGTYVFSANSETSGAFRITNLTGTASKTGAYSSPSLYELALTYDLETVTTTNGTYNVITTERWTKVSDTP